MMNEDEQFAIMQLLMDTFSVNLDLFATTDNPVPGEEPLTCEEFPDSIDQFSMLADMQNMVQSSTPESTPGNIENFTTIMIRNVPRKCTQRMLMADVVSAGFGETMDFVYLPTDISSARNLGYAFINFIHPHYAECFRESFHKKHLSSMRGSRAGLSVSYAVIQGREANIDNVMKNASVHRIRNPEYLPLVLNAEGRLAPAANSVRRNSTTPAPLQSSNYFTNPSSALRAH